MQASAPTDWPTAHALEGRGRRAHGQQQRTTLTDHGGLFLSVRSYILFLSTSTRTHVHYESSTCSRVPGPSLVSVSFHVF